AVTGSGRGNERNSYEGEREQPHRLNLATASDRIAVAAPTLFVDAPRGTSRRCDHAGRGRMWWRQGRREHERRESLRFGRLRRLPHAFGRQVHGTDRPEPRPAQAELRRG